MGVFRTFRTVLGGGDEIFMVLPNYLSSPVPTLSFFVLPTHLFYWVNLNRLGLQNAHPAPLQRFRIFPFLGRSRFSEIVGSNPASPSLGFLRGLFLSEEVPEGWWGSCLSEFATESLPTVIHSELTDLDCGRNFSNPV